MKSLFRFLFSLLFGALVVTSWMDSVRTPDRTLKELHMVQAIGWAILARLTDREFHKGV